MLNEIIADIAISFIAGYVVRMAIIIHEEWKVLKLFYPKRKSKYVK